VRKAKSSDPKYACCVDLVFGHKYWMSHKLKIKLMFVSFRIVLPILEIEPTSIDFLHDSLPWNELIILKG